MLFLLYLTPPTQPLFFTMILVRWEGWGGWELYWREDSWGSLSLEAQLTTSSSLLFFFLIYFNWRLITLQSSSLLLPALHHSASHPILPPGPSLPPSPLPVWLHPFPEPLSGHLSFCSCGLVTGAGLRETLVSCIWSGSLCSGDSVCSEMLPGPHRSLASSRLWPRRSLETGGWKRVATWALETQLFLLLLCIWPLIKPVCVCVCVCVCVLGEGIFKRCS